MIYPTIEHIADYDAVVLGSCDTKESFRKLKGKLDGVMEFDTLLDSVDKLVGNKIF